MAKIKARLKATGQIGTVEEKEFSPLLFEKVDERGLLQRAVESPLLPAIGGIAGGIGGTAFAQPIIGAGVGATGGYALRDMIKKFMGYTPATETPEEVKTQAGGALRGATEWGLTSGLLAGTTYPIARGVGALTNVLRYKPKIQQLSQQRTAIQTKQELEPMMSIWEDMKEELPKRVRTSLPTAKILQKAKNLLRPLEFQSVQQGPTGGYVSQPQIQQYISDIDTTDWGSRAIDKQIATQMSNVLREYYTKQVPGVPELNLQLQKLYQAKPEYEEMRKTARNALIRYGIGAGLFGIGGAGLIGAIKGK